MRIGFIGLGNLGRAIAQRLIDQGVELTVWNRTKEKAEGLNAVVAETPLDLAGKVDLVFLCLFDTRAVKDVISGTNGLFTRGFAGKTVVDLTTNHFREIEEVHNYVNRQGAVYLEAPVAGSVIPAQQGNLTVFVSGPRTTFDCVHPYLSKFGKNIFYLEKPTLATKMKLINNLLLGSFMASIGEAIVMGEKAGIPKAEVIEMLLSGAGNSGVFTAKKQRLLDEDFSPHFAVGTIYKDLHFLQDLARDLKRPVFTGSIAKELYGLAMAHGMEDQDFSAVYKLLKKP